MLHRARRRMRGAAALFALALAAGILSGQTTGPATQAAADPHLLDILQRLGDQSFQVREKAQHDLAALPVSMRDALKKLADQTTDDEIKARLVERVDQIDEELAVDPGPISVDFKDASLPDVADALSKAMGMQLDSWPPRNMGNSGDRFTLHAENQSFWEIMVALNKQSSISLQNYDKLKLALGGEPIKRFVLAKGMAVIPGMVSRIEGVDLQNEAGKEVLPPRLVMTYKLAFDPRVQLVDISEPWVKVVDDAGNVLLEQEPQSLRGFSRGGQFWMTDHQAELKIPAHPGKKIASVVGKIQLKVAISTETKEVANIEEKYKDPIQLGAATVQFTQFQVNNDTLNFSVSVTSSEKPKPLPMMVRGPGGGMRRIMMMQQVTQGVTMTLIDATGQEVMTEHLTGGMSSSGMQVKGPLKVRLSAPTRTKDMVLDFELKDLPLPAK